MMREERIYAKRHVKGINAFARGRSTPKAETIFFLSRLVTCHLDYAHETKSEKNGSPKTRRGKATKIERSPRATS